MQEYNRYRFPKLSLFDLDGTLVHHDHDFFYPQFVKLYDALGRRAPSRGEFDVMARRQHLFRDIPEGERAAFEESFWRLFDKIGFPDAVLIDGTLEVLDRLLTGGSRIAIVTARTHLPEDVERCLQKTGMLKYISVISTLYDPALVDDYSGPGLKKKQILEVCRKMQIAPGESMIAGDSPTDITSGRLAGVSLTVGLLSGGLEEMLIKAAEPHLLLESVAVLPAHLHEPDF